MWTLFSVHTFVKNASKTGIWPPFHACFIQHNVMVKMHTFQGKWVTIFKVVAYRRVVLANALCAVNHDQSPYCLYARRYSANRCGCLCGRRCSMSSNGAGQHCHWQADSIEQSQQLWSIKPVHWRVLNAPWTRTCSLSKSSNHWQGAAVTLQWLWCQI